MAKQSDQEVYVRYQTPKPLWLRRLITVLAFAVIIGWFTFVAIGPNLTDAKVEGDIATNDQIAKQIAGNWQGYWKSSVDRINEDLTLELQVDREGAIKGRGKARNENCEGDGGYQIEGKLAEGGAVLAFVSDHPGCGQLEAKYSMIRDQSGAYHLKVNYFRTPRNARGQHYLKKHP